MMVRDGRRPLWTLPGPPCNPSAVAQGRHHVLVSFSLTIRPSPLLRLPLLPTRPRHRLPGSQKAGRIGQERRCETKRQTKPRFGMEHQPRSGAPRPSPEDSRDMLTAKELETILKIDVKTIYSYVRRGLIPYVRIQSNVRFLKREIFDWIEKQSYRPRPDARIGHCPRPAAYAKRQLDH